VVELPRERPDPALELFWDVPDLRILVVGGDGTVGWILSCLDRIEHAKDGGAATGWQQPPIAMLPLGTGPLKILGLTHRGMILSGSTTAACGLFHLARHSGSDVRACEAVFD